jgi:hypothetical protein
VDPKLFILFPELTLEKVSHIFVSTVRSKPDLKMEENLAPDTDPKLSGSFGP